MQLLAQQQSNLLLQKLGAAGAGVTGAEGQVSSKPADVLSPQPLKPAVTAPSGVLAQTQDEDEAAPTLLASGIPEPAYHGPGAAWERDEGYLQTSTALPPSEEEKDVLET